MALFSTKEGGEMEFGESSDKWFSLWDCIAAAVVALFAITGEAVRDFFRSLHISMGRKKK